MAINPLHAPLQPGGPMSVEEYLQLDRSTLDGRYDYVGGVARLMSGGSVAHNRISRNVANAIEDHFLTGPCTVFGSDVQVLIGVKASGRQHYVYPDATVSCDVADRRLDNNLIRLPRIVVEVLSPGTEVFDRGKKLAAYKACDSIQEIMLVHQFAPIVEVYRRSEKDQASWQHVVYGPEQAVELRSVDICLSMDELYRGLNFDEPQLEE
ncbi:Uma2 family endonuclease [Ktedonosporobacter rubrisoli]|nr:Uma2 family endonuclease [Ktedonosporobacter rubrisoli]